MADRILVTGAAGFIGRAVAERLANAGFEVRAGLRRSGARFDPRIEPTACDLDHEAEIRSALSGVSLVVHAAFGEEGAMVGQCRRLLDAMAAEGVRGLVHLSSIAVYGEREGAIRETDGPQGDPGGYGRAKLGCEAAVRTWAAAAPGRRAWLLRPGAVYGRGSVLWVDKMIERIRAGALEDFGAAAAGPAPLVHVDDVAAAVEAAARRFEREPAAGEDAAVALNIVGPDAPPWRDYFSALAAVIGAPPLRPVGASELAARRALAVPAKVWARLGGPGLRRFALTPAPGEFALFSRNATFATDEAERLIGFRASIGLAEGLARSVGAPQPKA